ncbi:hypothetical protein [Lacisediminihabitans profunda]|nr:hypothetical protein [Lacisediminihabitans profunda]
MADPPSETQTAIRQRFVHDKSENPPIKFRRRGDVGYSKGQVRHGGMPE